MADTMQFDIVSPERMLASVEATSVKLPGTEGDLTAMPGHAPVITTLRPGLVSAEGPGGTTEFVVSGGFAEISPSSISVLAERAVPRSEVTQDFLEDLRKEAEAAHAVADGDDKDTAAKLLGDLSQLAQDMV